MRTTARRRVQALENARGWRALGRLFILIFALAIAAAVAFSVLGADSWLSVDSALEWMHRTGWGWAVGTALIVSDLVLPIPTAAVMAGLGVLYGALLGGLVSASASILAGLLGYCACRAMGRGAAERLVGREGIADAQALLESWGFGLVIVSRWLPVFAETVAFLAGLAAMPFRPFLAALVAGTLPVSFFFAAAGHIGQQLAGGVIVLSAILPVAILFIAHRLLMTR